MWCLFPKPYSKQMYPYLVDIIFPRQRAHGIVLLIACLFTATHVLGETFTRSAERPSANPNRDHKERGFALYPAAELSMTYDSNAFLTEENERESDLFMDVILGLSGRLSSGRNSLTLGGWYRMRRYDEVSRLDNEDYTLTLSAVIGSDTLGMSDHWTIRPRASYGKTIDYTHDPDELLLREEDSPTIRLGRPDREQQRRLTLGVDASGPATDKLWLSLGYGYSHVRYKRDDLFDDKTHKLGASASARITERSRIVLAGDFAELDNDSFDDPVYHYALRLGINHQRTDKISLNSSVGYYSVHATEREVEREGLSFTLGAHWRLTPKVMLSLTGDNTTELAEDDPGNARIVSRAIATLRHRLTTRWWWDVAVGYRREDYNRPSPPPVDDLTRRADVPGGIRPFRDPDAPFIDREVEQYIARLGLMFWINNYAHLRGSATYEDTRDNVIGDYEQYRFTIALRVAI